ncbi:MAG: hypothetical protein R3E04_03400 [Sphingobium sp.]
MVRKTESQLRNPQLFLSESLLAEQISQALREELGASRRATKTVMRWTGVSDTTARAWLHGRASPNGLNLVTLAAHSEPVMSVFLQLTGHSELQLGLKLQEIEDALVQALAYIREMQPEECEPS